MEMDGGGSNMVVMMGMDGISVVGWVYILLVWNGRHIVDLQLFSEATFGPGYQIRRRIR